MKTFRSIFIFVFSFYLLFLSAQPCQDFADGEFSRPQSENEQVRLHDGGERDRESESGECSPFCICSCRQVSANYNFTSLPKAKEAAVFTESTDGISYRSDYLHQPLDSIWQPTKFYFTV